jgi:IclR helix-turn-helix domain
LHAQALLPVVQRNLDVKNTGCRQSSSSASIAPMKKPSDEQITITLSPAQVDQVLRAASRSTAPGIATLISGTLHRHRDGRGAATRNATKTAGDDDASPANGDDRRLSRSLLRGLSILTCFGAPEEERGIVELAQEAGMSASTAHRYALTLIELGLLERSPRSRKYRLPAAP